MLTSLALISVLASTTPVAAEGSAAVVPPAPPSAADSVVAAAFGKDVVTKPTELKAESQLSLQNVLAPTLGIIGLAAMAFTLKRRKEQRTGSISIVEASSLGDKRSLVIADVLGERLVLAVSEAGVTVLMSKPAPETEPAAIVLPPAPGPTSMGFFARLKGRAASPAFDATLQESIEDQELRAKLAAGLRSVVP
jgi:flagellar biogenesis protein FliO